MGTENVIICQGQGHQISLKWWKGKHFRLYIDQKKISKPSFSVSEKSFLISAKIDGEKYEIEFAEDNLKELPPSGFSEKDFRMV